MNTCLVTLARVHAGGTWAVALFIVAVACALYFGRGKIHRVLAGLLIAMAVIIFVLWLIAALGVDFGPLYVD